MAVKELKTSRKLAKKAYSKAIKTQRDIEEKFVQIGREAIKQINGNSEMGIVLVGRSYNAFPDETSLFIPKKLASMGITVIPFDFLEKQETSNIPWYFANYVKTAIKIVNENNNLFLLYINSFSCTIDAFIQNYVRTEMNNIPYLLLELDAHTAAAGIQTRLEAFIEIVQNYQMSKKKLVDTKFQIARIKRREGKTVIFTSDN